MIVKNLNYTCSMDDIGKTAKATHPFTPKQRCKCLISVLLHAIINLVGGIMMFVSSIFKSNIQINSVELDKRRDV